MLHTPLLDLLRIEHPIIQSSTGTFGSGAALAAAVSNAGAMGTIGAAKRTPEDLADELRALRSRTDRPFAVTLSRPWLRLHPECLDVALAAHPAAISFSAGLAGDDIARIHDRGALAIVQVQTVEQAQGAAEEGVDVIVVQGAEASGYGALIGLITLVPRAVDAVAPLPVVAAGGIADGRSLAAVLLLGAAGAYVGTRFHATHEAAAGSAGNGDGGPPLAPADPGRPNVAAADVVVELVHGAEERLLQAPASLVARTPV